MSDRKEGAARMPAERLNLLDDLLAKAKRAGAESADAVMVDSASLSVAWRMGTLERLERAENADIGLRVFIGKRQACVSSSDRSPLALDTLVERCVAMARTVPEDPFCGLAEPGQLATGAPPDLDTLDPSEPTAETLIDQVRRAEDAARAVPGITNSEGAEAGWGRSHVAVAATNGFHHAWSGSSSSISVAVLAGEGTAMERDTDSSSVVWREDLRAPEDIGHAAAHRAVARLNSRKLRTCKVPVVFDPRNATGLVGTLSGAINGAAIARGTSFLKDRMDKRVLPAGVHMIDDPHRRRGLRSKSRDAEGLANRRRMVIEDGILTTWFLDLRSARQLGLESTGHASRGTASPPSPSPTNLYIEKGHVTPGEMISDIRQGLYVTELIGFGVNTVTGDYSRGAAGFWIEDGEIAYPVSEITIAGHMSEMFLNLTPANDLVFRYGFDSPTLRIDGMTVAGR
ncbi:MAG: TldD/PmbA family protein [Alphaproteobacteria bacterium]|nr:TldD/PmbA family protein [Alphaproteobacteria bacterium]